MIAGSTPAPATKQCPISSVDRAMRYERIGHRFESCMGFHIGVIMLIRVLSNTEIQETELFKMYMQIVSRELERAVSRGFVSDHNFIKTEINNNKKIDVEVMIRPPIEKINLDFKIESL